MINDYDKMRRVARGEAPADLLFINGRVVSVFTGEILEANVAVSGSFIAGVGDYRLGSAIVDLQGTYLLPGFIDSHIHIESSMLTPASFAEAAVPHGTTAVLADPHEIVNVLGMAGWRYMVESSRGLALDFYWQIPSCVPATHMETAGGFIGPAELDQAQKVFPECPALAEMMNYPGVINGVEPVLELIAQAREQGLIIEGHAPGIRGRDLNAYLVSGCSSDHECTSREEALEKLRLGMRLLIREGSAAKNLEELLPLVDEDNFSRCAFCCDDRHPADLLGEGHIDHVLRKAVATGLPAARAVTMATLNPALHYGLKNRGAIAPGYLADIVIVHDLMDFRVEQVYKAGQLVAEQGQYLGKRNIPESLERIESLSMPELTGRLVLNPPPDAEGVRVIEVIPGQILTRCLRLPVKQALQDAAISTLAVVERHGRNGNLAVGLVKGFDLERGALASSVAHDSHNLILVGRDPVNMQRAAETVAQMGGGMAVVDGEEVLASLPLPVAGLMSPLPAAEVAAGYESLQRAARDLGCQLAAPFMTLSFLSLPVIPELRLTDQGLVDVNQFALVHMWESE